MLSGLGMGGTGMIQGIRVQGLKGLGFGGVPSITVSSCLEA